MSLLQRSARQRISDGPVSPPPSSSSYPSSSSCCCCRRPWRNRESAKTRRATEATQWEQRRCWLFEVNSHSSCSPAVLSGKDEGCRSAGGSLLKGGFAEEKEAFLKKSRFVGKRSSTACTFSRQSQLYLSASALLVRCQVMLGYPAVVFSFFSPCT